MPSYNYICKVCNTEHIVDCSAQEYKSNIECPKCGSIMNRKFSPINSIWKCGGAYGKSSN